MQDTYKYTNLRQEIDDAKRVLSEIGLIIIFIKERVNRHFSTFLSYSYLRNVNIWKKLKCFPNINHL